MSISTELEQVATNLNSALTEINTQLTAKGGTASNTIYGVADSELKKYLAGQALESIATYTGNLQSDGETIPVISFNAIDGTNISSLYYSAYSRYTGGVLKSCPLAKLVPVATNELSEFSETDNSVVAVGTQAYSVTRSADKKSITYTVSVSAGESDISFNCVKFQKNILVTQVNSVYKDVLCYGVFLQNAVTVTARATKSISITFDIV